MSLTKTVKLEIIKPVEPVTQKQLRAWLRDFQQQSRAIANLMITKYWSEYQEYGQISKTTNYLYPEIKDKYPNVARATINQIEKYVKAKWKAKRKDIINGESSLISFKKNFPLLFTGSGDTYKILKEDDNYYIDFQLFSKSAVKEELAPQTRIKVLVKPKDKSTRIILNRIISREYKKGLMQIFRDTRDEQIWYCAISYSFEPQEVNKIDPNHIMGIDLGVANAVYWAFNFSDKRGRIPGGEIDAFRKQIRTRRISIQNQGKYAGDARSGHGRSRKLAPLESLRQKEANFRDTINHRYARYIVDIALKNGCGIIQMEELVDMSKKPFLANWPYYDLREKIKYKAGENGIQLKLVNPGYTSQRCSRCGYINEENRKTRDLFECQKCGYGKKYRCKECGSEQDTGGPCFNCGGETYKDIVYADYNAAKNLSLSDIEEKIKEERANLN